MSNNTPPRQATPTYPNYSQQGYPPQNHYGVPPTGPPQPAYGAPVPSRTSSYGTPTPAAPPAWQAALALIPEDQRVRTPMLFEIPVPAN